MIIIKYNGKVLIQKINFIVNINNGKVLIQNTKKN